MTDEEIAKLAIITKLLNEQTPSNTPAREEIIQKTAIGFLQADRKMQRLKKQR